jgi:hypothetical protein
MAIRLGHDRADRIGEMTQFLVGPLLDLELAIPSYRTVPDSFLEAKERRAHTTYHGGALRTRARRK